MKTPLSSFLRLAVVSSICFGASAEATELSLIKGSFDNVGASSDARGVASAVFTPRNPKFRLDCWKLTPGATYQFTVDGVLEETFTASSRGSVHLDFRTNASTNKRALDFDPRGKTLAIVDETSEVLSLVFSGEGEPEDIRVDERTSLTRAESETRGRVQLRYLEQRNKDRFIVHFNGLERGNYELFVDGQLQAEVDLSRGRSTMRSFEVMTNALAKGGNGNGNGNGGGNSKKLELDFDPRGLIVDVVRDGGIIFTGEMLAQLPALDVVNAGETSVALATTGVDVDATGTASVALAEDGELSLNVGVTALPAGVYDVVVGGVVRGTVTVTGVEPDSTGEVVFSTDPEAGELLLDFDVLGETVEIRQGATVYLTGTLGLTLTELAPSTVVETELPLLNLGVEADASAHVTLAVDGSTLVGFEVELEGVAVGNYDFKVGGTTQGTLVVTDVDGVVSGELVYDNGGVELPLTFDPLGQTVTIEQGATILLSRTL